MLNIIIKWMALESNIINGRVIFGKDIFFIKFLYCKKRVGYRLINSEKKFQGRRPAHKNKPNPKLSSIPGILARIIFEKMIVYINIIAIGLKIDHMPPNNAPRYCSRNSRHTIPATKLRYCHKAFSLGKF